MRRPLERKEDFRRDEVKVNELHRLLQSPVMREAIDLIHDLACPTTVAGSMEVAALQGSYYAGCNFAINTLLELTSLDMLSNTSTTKTPIQDPLLDKIERIRAFNSRP
jgi:hypothetical protein